MALKSLNPNEVFEWSYKQCPETVFKFHCFSGPSSFVHPDIIAMRAINQCVISVSNFEVGGVEHPEWKNNGELSKMLPFPICNALAAEILSHSQLENIEKKALKSQSGSDSSEETDGNATSVQ